MMDDAQLLRDYAATHVEAAFAEVVRRNVNLVYSTALRQVNGDAHLAQDVTQLVFADLARKAAAVAEYRVLAAWLFTSTRFAAAKLVRGERRRQAREAEAQLMDDVNGEAAEKMEWERVRPVLDATLAELGEADREAILLRFFEGKDFASVGVRLSLSENAARMRVERALDKLHGLLARRGVTSTGAALAVALGGHAVVAAPAGLAATVTGAALAGGGGAVAVGAWMTFMSMTKLHVGISGALAVAGATGLVLQAQSNAELRDEVAGLRRENQTMAAARVENAGLRRAAAEVAEWRGDDAELARLTGEATALKTRMAAVDRAERVRAAANAAALAGAETFDLSKLDTQPRPTMQARPKYPVELRSAGISGEAVVDFIVDANGQVHNAHAVKSSLAADTPQGVVRLEPFTVAGEGTPSVKGRPVAELTAQLEAAAVEAVSQWKFTAGQKGGRKVNTHMMVPIVFTLNEK